MRLRTTIAAALSLEPTSLTLNGFPIECLFSALDNLKIGIAVCDRRLRFVAINRALAEMNNVPQEAHIGRAVHEVVGPLITKIEPLFNRVFSSGEPVPNGLISGQLPTRPDEGQWTVFYFPLRDTRGRVVQVGALVIELRSNPVLLGSNDLVPSLASRESPRDDFHAKSLGATHQIAYANARQTGVVLSLREEQVLRLLAEGQSNKEISSILAISVKTVETYRSRLMLKLQAPSLIHLVHYAIRHRIVNVQA